MNTLDAVVYQVLSQDAAFTALASTRVYPGEAPPDAALPYAVQEESSQEQVSTIQGAIFLDIWSLAVECYAAGRPAARALARAVKDVMLTMRGGVGGLFIKRVTLDDESADVVPADGGDGLGAAHVVSLTFRVQYSEGG